MCDKQVLVAWVWRCSAHGLDNYDRWMCPACARAHESHWLGAAEACLWWRPKREGGVWYQQAIFGGPTDLEP